MNLTDTELLILAVLEGDELYGRQVADAVADRTNGKRRISIAGLYTTLGRMETQGLLTARWSEDESENRPNARRRYYRASGAGQRVLREHRAAIGISLTPEFGRG